MVDDIDELDRNEVEFLFVFSGEIQHHIGIVFRLQLILVGAENDRDMEIGAAAVVLKQIERGLRDAVELFPRHIDIPTVLGDERREHGVDHHRERDDEYRQGDGQRAEFETAAAAQFFILRFVVHDRSLPQAHRRFS